MIKIDPKKLSAISNTPIEKLALDNKAYLRLKDCGINNVGDYLRKNNDELLSIVRGDQAALDSVKNGIIKLVQSVDILSFPIDSIEIKTEPTNLADLGKDNISLVNSEDSRNETINFGTDPIRKYSTESLAADPLEASILDLDISSKTYYALRFSNLDTVKEIISNDFDTLKKRHRRLDYDKIKEIKHAIRLYVEQKGFVEILNQYPLFKENRISIEAEKTETGMSNMVDDEEETIPDNRSLSISREWSDDDLAHEYGQLYYGIQELLKKEYDNGSLWINVAELQTRLGEQFPFLIESINEPSKIETVLDNASWVASASVFYCWKPSECLEPQDAIDTEKLEEDRVGAAAEYVLTDGQLAALGENNSFEYGEEAEASKSIIDDYLYCKPEIITTAESDEEKSATASKLSLEDCIKAILAQRKKAGRELVMARTVYNTLREKYPSVADTCQLVDVRDVLTTSIGIEKEDFYYRLSEDAFKEIEGQAVSEKSEDEELFCHEITAAYESSNYAQLPILSKSVTIEDDVHSDASKAIENETIQIEKTDSVDCAHKEANKFDDSSRMFPAKHREINETETLAGDILQERVDAIETIPIDVLNLSVRSYNCLKRTRINTIGDLVKLTPDKLLRIQNMGERSQREVIEKLQSFLPHYDEYSFFDDDANDIDSVEKSLPQKRVIKGTIIYDIPIKQMGLSVRATNCLERAGIVYVSEILYWNREDFLKLRNMGVGSANEILHKIEELYTSGQIVAAATEEELQIAKEEYYSSEDFRNGVIKAISMLLNDAGYKGTTIGNITKVLPEDIEEEYLLPVLDDMMREGSVICVNGLYRKEFPSILDAIKVLPDDHQQFIRDRLEGKTLEEIANYAGITSERVRQIVSKDIRTLKEGNKNVDPVHYFSEDAYEYLYQNYCISRSEWLSVIGKPEYIFNYLQTAYKRGSKLLSLALDDSNVDESIKHSIQAADDENYIIVGNKRIKKARKEIEDYVIFHYFKDEGTVDEFYDTYKAFLDECGIEDIGLFATDDVKKTRENRISDSKKVLWKQNRRLRYYDIDGTDFEELFDTLDLHQYDNVELSTYKFVRDYPELMDEYDIRDEYELHNLLKKTCDPNEYPNIQFGRMPGIVFGQFNRDDAVKEMLFDLAPITQDDLAEALCEKYGFKVPTIKANWLDCIDEYYFSGEYHVENEDEKTLSEEQLQQLDELLSGDFYLTDEVARIYSRVTGERQSPRAYVLKRMGFKVYSDYIFRGAGTANEFFLNLLTGEDIVDLGSYGSKLRYLVTFNMVEHALREEYEILEFEPHKYVNIRRLASFDMDKSDVIAYCNEVKKFVGEEGYFTIPWLRSQGFTSKLDDLGFEDFFYEAILAMDPGIYSFIQRSDKRRGSALLKVGDSLGSKSDFLVRLIEREGSIDKDELISYCRNKYNIELTDNSIYHAIEDSDVYYDGIMGKYYANYSLYFEEI